MTMDIYYKYKTQNNVKSTKTLYRNALFYTHLRKYQSSHAFKLQNGVCVERKRWISFAMKHVAHYTNSLLSVS
jgi:hypothetical protein